MKVFKTILGISIVINILFMLQSCYSVRLVSINGGEQPDPLSERSDYYRNMMVVEKDTTISIDLTSKEFTYLIKESDSCKTGKLHTVEYRNTLGGVLLSAITLGKKRRMKVKYVCMEPTN